MQFKQWLEVRVPAEQDLKVKARGGMYRDKEGNVERHYQNAFYVDDKGNIVPGYGNQTGSWSPYFTLRGRDKAITLHNIEPTSKLFKDIIKRLINYVPDIMNWEVDILGLSHSRSGKMGWRKGYSSVMYGNQDRPVSYWFKHPATDFTPGKMPRYLYHGTSTELWYEGISKRGLLPRLQSQIGAAGSYGAGSSLSRDNLVYLAVHPDAATRGAAEQSASQHGGKALILRIDTKGLDWTKFTYDEDFESQYKAMAKTRKLPAQVSAQGMGTVGYEGRVPASLIEPLLVGEREVNTNLISWKWRKFADEPRDIHPLTKLINNNFEKKFNISDSDTPYFYALIDAGLMKEEKGYYYPTREVTDQEIRKLIKDSTWVREAQQIVKYFNSWGSNPLTTLAYMPRKVDNKEYQKVIDFLVDNDVYQVNDNYVKSDISSWEYVKIAIKLAKALQKEKMSLSSLIEKMKEIDKAFPDR